MLEVKDLSVKLGSKKILDSLSFDIPEGKITVILGKNGSGKTTLLRTLSSDLLKREGNIYIDGIKDDDLLDKEYGRKVAFLPSILNRPAISVRQLLEFGYYLESEIDGVKLDYVIEELGLKEIENSLVCHLSSGQRQLAYFGMLMIKDSKYNLLDEPTSNLDVEVKKLVYEKLKELKDKGKAVLLSIHDINESLGIGDNIIVMDKGKIVFNGEKKEFIESDIAETVFHLNRIVLKDNDGGEYIIYK